MFTIKRYHTLCLDAMEIRTKVFIDEQHFKDEFDEIDKTCTTLVGYIDDKPIACARAFYDEKDKRFKIGRFAVLKEYRGQDIGSCMLEETIKVVKEQGGEYAYLHSQMQAQPFYEKNGFEAFGEIEYEEHCPHIWMKKKI